MLIFLIVNLRDDMAKTANAVTEEIVLGRNPKTFAAKYTSPFAKLFRSLCEEIVTRSQWHEPLANEEKLVLTS